LKTTKTTTITITITIITTAKVTPISKRTMKVTPKPDDKWIGLFYWPIRIAIRFAGLDCNRQSNFKIGFWILK